MTRVSPGARRRRIGGGCTSQLLFPSRSSGEECSGDAVRIQHFDLCIVWAVALDGWWERLTFSGSIENAQPANTTYFSTIIRASFSHTVLVFISYTYQETVRIVWGADKLWGTSSLPVLTTNNFSTFYASYDAGLMEIGSFGEPTSF